MSGLILSSSVSPVVSSPEEVVSVAAASPPVVSLSFPPFVPLSEQEAKEESVIIAASMSASTFVFFFIFCALAALPTTPVDFFDNSSADCCVEVQVSFDGATATAAIHTEAKDSDDIIAAINVAFANTVSKLPALPEAYRV